MTRMIAVKQRRRSLPNHPVVAPQFTIEVTLQLDKAKEVPKKMVMDTGAETNVISQRYALGLGLEKAPVPKPGDLRYPGNHKGTVYAAYAIRWRATDSTGRTREDTTIFYGTDEPEESISLGMPGIISSGIVLDPRSRNWRFEFEPQEMHLQSADDFAASIDENGGEVFVCSIRRRHDGDLTASVVRVASFTTAKGEQKAQELIDKYQDVFEMPDRPLPCDGVEHEIETTADPPFGPIYNLSERELQALREYLDTALERGWIRYSTSSAGSPILFVPKKDGGLRLCVDYRALNKVTVKNRMALPLISEILDRVAGSQVFSKIDLEAAYYRIAIKRSDRWKTAFRTRYGHFEYNVMPFGLTNAPATFQAYINKALLGLVDVICIVYLDDILIFSKNEQDHERHLEEVLERLRRHALYANPKKCTFFTDEVEYLGFLIGKNGTRMDPSRVEAIAGWPVPKNFKELQIFLGFVNFYRRFIDGFAHISRPLSDLLKGSKDCKHFGTWQWGEAEDQAFRWLREAFTHAPILVHFDPTKNLMIETDASAFAAAAILSLQGEDDHWHPVAYWSRKLVPAETRYKVHDQELLAIIESFRQWRHYLDGSTHAIRVVTDHNNLVGFMTTPKLNGRQARWLMELAEFDFHVVYRQGKKNPADAPSRRPDYAPAQGEIDADARSMLPTLQRKLGLLRTDLGDKGIREWIDSEAQAARLPVPARSSRISALAEERYGPGDTTADTQDAQSPSEDIEADGDSLAVQCVPLGVARIAARRVHHVYGEEDSADDKPMTTLIAELQRTDGFTEAKRQYIDEHPDGPWSKEGEDNVVFFKDRLFVPDDRALKRALLRRFHDAPLAGHFGKQRTLELIQRHYHWVGIEKDVAQYVTACTECQWANAKRHRPYGKLQSLEVPAGPWQDLSMDFITDLPPSKGRQGAYDAILVVVDRFTKMSLYTPTSKTVKAEDVADILIERVMSFAGVPKSIVSDRGSQFTSLLWQEFCTALQIKRRLSTAFHPQTDGQTERQNQTLETNLRIFCNENQDNWAQLLPLAEFAYNNSIHSVTQETPFYLMYGFHPRAAWDEYDVQELKTRLGNRKIPALEERLARLRVARESTAKRLEAARQSQAEYYNRSHQEKFFRPGDQVMMSTKHLALTRPKKGLSPKYLGPLEVIEPVGKNAYRLRLPDKWRIHDVVNITQLEDWVERPEGDLDVASQPQNNLPEEVSRTQEWEVEAVVDRQWDSEKGELYYLVRWEGDWPPDQKETWEPASHLRNAADLVDSYDKSYPRELRPPKSNLSQKAGVTKKASTRGRKRKRGK